MYQNESAPWILFRAWNTDGTPKTDLVYNTTGIVLYQARNNEAKTTITLSNAASATDWAAGKFWQISGNLYRVGISTGSISAYTGFITVQGSYTGGTLDGIAVEVEVVPATLSAVQGELPTNFGDLVINESGHIGRVVLVDTTTTNTDMRGTNSASTHDAADVITAMGTGTFLTEIPWNAAWDAEVQSEVNDALVALDLDSALIAQGAERAVNVDNSHRVHSHVYDMQANTITASALAADAGAEIAALVETYIVNEGDATATMQAIADKIAADWVAGDASPLAVATAVWSAATRSLTDKAGFALSATGLDLVTSWTTDITGSLSGNVGGIAGTINTLDQLDTAQDTQHGTTRTAVDDAFTVIKGATWSGTTDTLEAIRDRGDVAWITGAGGGGSGTGARTITVTIDDGTDPLENAIVRMTEGVNTYTALSDVTGVATFNLDDATYVVAITKSGYSYAGTTLLVDGDETETYSLTQVATSPPADPALCAVTIHVRDQYGVDLPDEPVEITFVSWAVGAADTVPVLSPPPVQTTDVDGTVAVNLYRNAVYKIIYGSADYALRANVTVPDAGTYEVTI